MSLIIKILPKSIDNWNESFIFNSILVGFVSGLKIRLVISMDFSNTSQAIYFTNTTSFLFNHVIIVDLKPFSFVPRSCLCVSISPYTRR